MEIWVVEKSGDDYHGTSIVAWFDDQSLAEDYAKREQNNQDPCPECGYCFRFYVYSIPKGG